MTVTDKVLGIDLGTTNSAVAVIQEGVPMLIPVAERQILPSVVGVSPQGELLVGQPARNQWVVAPEATVRSIKRKMGSTETVTMAGRRYSPQEISAFILRELKGAAERALSRPLERAVITVPAYFNELQRQATIEAGEIAGLQVERIINEPTAAALAYGLDREEDLRVLVYDLGGGTFDVSLIELMGGVLDVRATAGDNSLGGDDFDELLAELLADEFAEEHGLDLRQHKQAWARLLRAAEEAKIELSSAPFATVSLEYLLEEEGRPLHLRREVAREEFEDLLRGLLKRTLTLTEQALADAEFKPEDIDRVLLVGGSTRIPAVRRLLAQHLRQEPHLELDPEAVVALGAAVQAGIVAGEEVSAILVDVTPLSLGIETAHVGVTGRLETDHFARLIYRNTTIPTTKSEVFTTLYPGQEAIHIKVYQGEEDIASKNTLLGDFMIEELTPNRPDGLTDMTVEFSLDVSGILDVTVAERGGGKQVSRQLKASRQRLSPEQIAKGQAKLAAVGGKEVALDEATAALIKQAQDALERPELSSELAGAIAGAVADIKEAAAAGDEGRLAAGSDALVDLLLEVD